MLVSSYKCPRESDRQIYSEEAAGARDQKLHVKWKGLTKKPFVPSVTSNSFGATVPTWLEDEPQGDK